MSAPWKSDIEVVGRVDLMGDPDPRGNYVTIKVYDPETTQWWTGIIPASSARAAGIRLIELTAQPPRDTQAEASRRRAGAGSAAAFAAQRAGSLSNWLSSTDLVALARSRGLTVLDPPNPLDVAQQRLWVMAPGGWPTVVTKDELRAMEPIDA